MTQEQKKQQDDEQRKQARAELAERITLGKAGKLWRIQFTYHTENNSVAFHTLHNRTDRELMQVRDLAFTAGFMVYVEPGHWKVIPPLRILDVDVYRQAKYFDEI